MLVDFHLDGGVALTVQAIVWLSSHSSLRLFGKRSSVLRVLLFDSLSVTAITSSYSMSGSFFVPCLGLRCSRLDGRAQDAASRLVRPERLRALR